MNKQHVFIVQDYDVGKRIDLFLLEQNVFESRSFIQNLIKNNQVTVNEKQIKSSYKVCNNDEITVYLSSDFSIIIEPQDIPISIIYEDDDILVVNKPKNMLTHPSAKENKNTLVNALLFKYGYEGLSDLNGMMRPGIVHRLDRNTSGLLMIAKNNMAHEFLTKQIKDKTAIRKYLAVVRGNFEQNEGIIDLPISRSIKNPAKMDIIDGGKNSITKYKVLEAFKGYSFIELTLLTGRTHQIRVHLNHIGHAVLNDSLYNNEKFKVKTTEQVLQAYKLQFTTLKNNDIINLEINQDEDINKVLKFLRSLK